MRRKPNSVLNKWLWAVLLIVTAVCSVFIFLMLRKDVSVNVARVINETDQSGVIEPQEAFVNTPATAPVPARTAAPTQTPEAKPTPEPVTVTFTESSELRLPGLKEALQYGQPFNLRGTVESSQALAVVTASVFRAEANEPQPLLEARVTFRASDNIKVYTLDDAKTPEESTSINGLLSFRTLQAGWYTLEISATPENAKNVIIAKTDFCVEEPSEWLQLTSNSFRDNYSHALSFFKRTERFMFKYKWAQGRNIITDPKWVNKYITSIEGLNGEDWKVHTEAASCFEKAIDYLKNTYVRVQGNGHDSGVVKLSKLVKTFNGAYYSRFVTDKTFISHHAFGTAVDCNAFTQPNNNEIENHDIIQYEVKDCLEYNGIKKDGKRSYHDFRYSGNWQEYYADIPTSLLNYLLYELAFYRAGFGWGYYYSHTCDAMHFSLSERDISEHDDDSIGLRKVYEY